ncbi:hypothetical protein NC653_031986 [Populus alba x Populus x berolinensis]|uniref:Uncharacterized protein n=1 Tax=Populus alba x Populus x berolinensis TaxID=444605 RepID=A0AAD6Q237_9ROSI|nr:hypothetical protein NC653_031986 [Populus alba x Populus x berolinensis]
MERLGEGRSSEGKCFFFYKGGGPPILVLPREGSKSSLSLAKREGWLRDGMGTNGKREKKGAQMAGGPWLSSSRRAKKNQGPPGGRRPLLQEKKKKKGLSFCYGLFLCSP